MQFIACSEAVNIKQLKVIENRTYLLLDSGKTELYSGKMISYFPNHQVQILGQYKNGLQNEMWIYYDSLGNVIGKKNFNHGIILQEYLLYQNGKLKSEKISIDKGMTHIYREYFQDGKIKMTGRFKNGMEYGKWVTFNENRDTIMINIIDSISNKDTSIGLMRTKKWPRVDQ